MEMEYYWIMIIQNRLILAPATTMVAMDLADALSQENSQQIATANESKR